MGIISSIFKQYADEYLERYGARMPSNHRKVIKAIRTCRTSACGMNHYSCENGDYNHTVYRGCGNRHCPNCQQARSEQWLAKRLSEQLPGPHFMVTFTVPAELRPLLRSHQRDGYTALFEASSQALKELAGDMRLVGGDLPGFFGVLHTWGRQLSYHPHIHYVIPGGAVCRKSKRWMPSHEKYFAPTGALSKLVRGKFRDAMKARGLYGEIPLEVWGKSWTVDSQALGANTSGALKYLAPYVFRVAISDSRIVRFEHRQVTFRYRDSETNEERIMTLEVMEFMRRFLQHVLPVGFMKIRYYGFMAPGSSIRHEDLVLMIETAYSFELRRPEVPAQTLVERRCPLCGGRMELEATLLPHEMPMGPTRVSSIINAGIG